MEGGGDSAGEGGDGGPPGTHGENSGCEMILFIRETVRLMFEYVESKREGENVERAETIIFKDPLPDEYATSRQ